MNAPAWTTELNTLLDSSIIFEPGSDLYTEETKTWEAQKNLNPKVLIRPLSLEQLSRLLVYLNGSSLDYGIRSGGIGSSSAKDVLISLAAFDDFEFDSQAESVTVGAGQTWGEVDRKLQEESPGHIGKYCSL
jgi:FAD/FMN-containing dehydrogenase